MMATDEVKAKLKELRDRLALETPRARTRPQVPAELTARLEAALQQVSGMYLLDAAPGAPTKVASQALADARDDALLEGHLALHDWERFVEQEREKRARARARPPTPPPLDRRLHARHDTQVAVKLLRYRVHDGPLGDVTLTSETASRPARNASLGGIFVAVDAHDLPRVTIGGVLHVSVTVGESLSFQARAQVVRRDSTGLALRWVLDSDGVKRSVESLLEALRKPR